jgi:16S rRNA (cytidine1402-2'-O)-methyltransferase
MKSFFAGNERTRLGVLRAELEAGKNVVLVSDAGMPIISDPGTSAVQVAVDCGATVGVVPGPSAVVTALAVSGFDGDRFVFDGFLPRKGGARSRALESLVDERRTIVLFAAPTRVAADLADLARVGGSQRGVVVTRELTKVYEEIWRGTLQEAAAYWGRDGTTKGEFTLVIEGAPEREPSMSDAVEAALGLISKGMSTSDAVRAVTATHGVRRNELYDSLVRAGS